MLLRGVATEADDRGAQTAEQTRRQPQQAAPYARRPRICVLGGGFGGLYAALRLAQLPWGRDVRRSPGRGSAASTPSERGSDSAASSSGTYSRLLRPEIVLIDVRERFVFLPLLYELVTGEMSAWEVAPPFSELLANTDIRFVQAQATGLDVANKVVKFRRVGADEATTAETSLSFERLVIALGSEDTRALVPGAKAFALGFRSVNEALALRERLRELEASGKETIRVVVVGGGYSGVELACNLSDRLCTRGQVQIIERGRDIMLTSTEFNRRQAKRALRARRIAVEPLTDVVEVAADGLRLVARSPEPRNNGSSSSSSSSNASPSPYELRDVDLILWTAGTRVNAFLREQLPDDMARRNERGQLLTDTFLRLHNHLHITVLGDAACVTDPRTAPGAQPRPYPMTAQIALQEADYAAWNVWASLTDRPLLPFEYVHLGEMVTLGRNDGSINLLGVFNLTGRVAHHLRRAAYIARMPTDAHRIRVGLSYAAQPLAELLGGMASLAGEVLDAVGQGQRTRRPGCTRGASDTGKETR